MDTQIKTLVKRIIRHILKSKSLIHYAYVRFEATKIMYCFYLQIFLSAASFMFSIFNLWHNEYQNFFADALLSVSLLFCMLLIYKKRFSLSKFLTFFLSASIYFIQAHVQGRMQETNFFGLP